MDQVRFTGFWRDCGKKELHKLVNTPNTRLRAKQIPTGIFFLSHGQIPQRLKSGMSERFFDQAVTSSKYMFTWPPTKHTNTTSTNTCSQYKYYKLLWLKLHLATLLNHNHYANTSNHLDPSHAKTPCQRQRQSKGLGKWTKQIKPWQCKVKEVHSTLNFGGVPGSS